MIKIQRYNTQDSLSKYYELQINLEIDSSGNKNKSAVTIIKFILLLMW